VYYVLTLLRVKGEEMAPNVRRRMASGQGVVAKGHHFEASVLEEALKRWDKERDAEAAPCARKTAAGQRSPAGPGSGLAGCPSTARSEAAPVGRAAGGASHSQGASTKCKRKLQEEDENVNPQTMREQHVPTETLARRRRLLGKSPHSEDTGGDAPAPAGAGAGASSRSVRELKALLSQAGVDCACCVEKADLQSLWDRFELFRARPLAELRASCAAAGGPRRGSVEECARFLRPRRRRGPGAAWEPRRPPPPSASAAR
ncbi:unnamed protein product, partial [Prorocentrum cordatum]